MSTAALYYGTEQSQPPHRTLTAGPWSALLIDGALHEIRYRGIEVIRMVAFLVRDKDWGTCRPSLAGIEVDEGGDAFRIAYRARCENPDGHVLSYAIAIDCAAGGALSLHADVTTHSDFLTARCGFCVLHPIDGVAGAPARVEHGDGTLDHAAFPTLIDPWQPFKDIRTIEHDLRDGLTVRCAFTGDVFEMEDQRNWSDASFKTYSRPLEWPWPYVLEAGATCVQSVTLTVDDQAFAASENAAVATSTRADDAITITLDLNESLSENEEAMPALGVAIAADEADLALARPALLAELAPQQLTLSFDPLAGHGVHELERFAALQRDSGLPAVLEYALPGVDAPRAELAALAAQLEASRLDVTGIVVSPAVHRQSNPPGSVSPPCPPMDDVYREARSAFPRLRIGGGMLSYFTELNRKRPPLELVDWVTHATCPIVHAADDRSVMQTLEAIPDITRSCRALIGKQPYAIGPASIGMRQNPYGSRVMPNPDRERIAMAAFDPRQQALFGAAWLAGYAAALAGARIDTLTLGALTGARGLADSNGTGARYPVFYVAAALARVAGARRLRCDVSGSDSREIACLASRDRDGRRLRVLIANLTDAVRGIRLDIGREVKAVQTMLLDEASAENLPAWHPIALDVSLNEEAPIVLRPFACLFVESES
ncbi:hypothetical protein [Paraburkholderia phosphatilytica]|uniref:D-apionate lactonase n=1 Tax=Paraburkholderia phosphatilytica TaxID=2282883 RepID=UPI000E4FCEEB|nr:hypothetical protein [Paraburkholderia phosphatilytica]